MQPIRVGVVGYGMAAQVMHLPFITTMREYQLVSVLERHNAHSKEKYPFVEVVKDIDEMLSNDSLDLIVITTPNDTHFPYTEKALRAGKHVLLEKPFTNTLEEAAALVELSKKTGKILGVYHNRRYLGDFLTMEKILSERLLGETLEYEGHFDRYRAEAKPNAWREEDKPGSGILYDLGSHLIDQALYLFGIPKFITADIKSQRPHAKVDDYFDLRLDYGSMKVILKSGMLIREPGPRYMINGRKGSYLKYFEDPQEALLKTGVLPNIPYWGEEPEDCWGLIHTEIDGKVIKEKYPTLKGSYGNLYLNLYKTIANGMPLRERPEHGYNTICMITLAIESNRKKATVACDGFMDVGYPSGTPGR